MRLSLFLFWVFSLVKCLCTSFVHFPAELLGFFFLLRFRSSSRASPWSGKWFITVLVCHLFLLFSWHSLSQQMVLNFEEAQLINFPFLGCIWGINAKNFLPSLRYKVFLFFSPKLYGFRFYVSCVICFKLIFYKEKYLGWGSLFCLLMSSCYICYKVLYFLHWIVFVLYQKPAEDICMGLFLCSPFYCVDLYVCPFAKIIEYWLLTRNSESWSRTDWSLLLSSAANYFSYWLLCSPHQF